MPRVARMQRALLVMFVFVVLVFGMLAWRSERAAYDLRVFTYTMCEGRRLNVERTNAYYAAMVRIERRNPYRATSPRTIKSRIRLYQDAMLTPPACGDDPR